MKGEGKRTAAKSEYGSSVTDLLHQFPCGVKENGKTSLVLFKFRQVINFLPLRKDMPRYSRRVVLRPVKAATEHLCLRLKVESRAYTICIIAFACGANRFNEQILILQKFFCVRPDELGDMHTREGDPWDSVHFLKFQGSQNSFFTRQIPHPL